MIPYNDKPCIFGNRQKNKETGEFDLVDTRSGVIVGLATEGNQEDGLTVVAVIRDEKGFFHTPSVWCVQELKGEAPVDESPAGVRTLERFQSNNQTIK